EGIIETRVLRSGSSALLKRQQEQYVHDNLPEDLVIESPERVLSLRSVEASLKEHLDRGKALPESLVYLGGLQRVDKVVIDPDHSDLLIVGPAEPFAPDSHGRILGIKSGRPPLFLDDLIVVLRSVMSGRNLITCSIDPTEENLANLQRYLQTNTSPATTSVARQRYQTMAKILGRQVVTLTGVPENSHFAVALVEADLRMKRIALGKEMTPVRGIRSQLSLLTAQGNSLQRWWFVPSYEPLETNSAGTVFVIRGQRAQLVAQEELSDSSGIRRESPQTRSSTEQFARLFSERFAELADASPPFAELQNLYDLSLVASLAAEARDNRLRNWPMDTFLNEERLSLATYPVPKYVRSEATSRKVGRVLLGLIGGVEMSLRPVISERNQNLNSTPEQYQRSEVSSDWFWESDSRRRP
ncbi:MAG: DUF1598 domain-containing protein, partial [Planctomycetaceae bacterium]|nr:DUF1598 domain-containing protein [Planctomycetaceae bacterium]